jgi:HSP20 family molecular chaperone IbpA
MKKQEKVSTKPAPAKKDEKALKTVPESIGTGFSPIFVEAEKMFERFNHLNREIGQKAFELFLKRGGEFGKAFDDWFEAESEVLMPVPIEIIENKDRFDVRATVPGFKPEEIEVSVKDNFLILSGKTETETRKEDENAVFEQWHSNRFFRALPLSKEVDADKVKATLKDGVLQLTLPILPDDRPKQIAVKGA